MLREGYLSYKRTARMVRRSLLGWRITRAPTATLLQQRKAELLKKPKAQNDERKMPFSSQILNHEFAKHIEDFYSRQQGILVHHILGRELERSDALKSPTKQDIHIPNFRHHFSVSVVKMVPAIEADRNMLQWEGANLLLLLLPVQSLLSVLKFCI